MTDYVTQSGYGLSAPASRHDVVSALLNEYGNSFGHSDGSPSASFPVPADKKLPPPPPPPRSDSLSKKPLPAVERAEQRMSMKFQLRAIDDMPLSPTSARSTSPEQRPKRRIVYRSLSREAKPPSLNLVTSNGSTAIVPATPVGAQTFPVPSSLETKDLPSVPCPPVKSEQRPNVEAPMGLKHSRSQRELARNDSLLSQSNTAPTQSERPANVEAVPVVKRKAIPEPVKKFQGLAELGTSRRGGKGGPLPLTSAPRKTSVDSQTSSTSQEIEPFNEEEVKVQVSKEQFDPPALNQLPPTPEDDKAPAPAPPPKVALGLPSNPRAKGKPVSPKHVRGKSSTGFSLLKAQRPAPPIPSMKVETITPEMTPSPLLKPNLPIEQDMSPLSPLPPPSDQRRPFSFEPARSANSPLQAVEQQQTANDMAPALPPSSSSPKDATQPRSLSPPEPSPTLRPSTAPLPPTQTPTPTSHHALPQSPTAAQTKDSQSPSITPPTPPPFTPLTRAPIPLPISLIPAITPAQLNCYTSHRHNIWSNNVFQPLGCMLCHQNGRDRKWLCTWCQLRICVGCSQELNMVEGREVGVLVEMRRARVGDMGEDGEAEEEERGRRRE